MCELYHVCVANSIIDISGALDKHLKYLPTSSMLIGEEALAKLDILGPDQPKNSFFLVDVFAEIGKIVTDPSEQIFEETFQNLLDLYEEKVIDLIPFVQEPFFLSIIEYVVLNANF